MIKAYTLRLLEMAPRWLRYNEGGKLLKALGSRIDYEIERLQFAMKAQHPGLIEFDALEYQSQDRLLRQGPAEANATFATRLVYWRNTHIRRGSAFALLEQLYAYMGAAGWSATSITYRNGVKYSLAVDGTVTRSISTEFNSVGPAAQWARYWVRIDGNSFANLHVDDIKRIVNDWHAEHCIGYGVIINGDRPWDNPLAWDTARAWDGPGTAVEWFVEVGGLSIG